MLETKKIQKTHKILIADDQELNRDVLGMILEEEYEVVYACDGLEAMEVLQKHSGEISLVMLDLIMPNMNGFEVLEAMRTDVQLKNIPVIVLTSEKEAELKALQLGAADFITKPFELHEVILARVARVIELCEGRELISAAEHDKITMLYSRNFFFEYANRLYTYYPEIHFDAVVLDIEKFHSLNDVNGRAFGDYVLRVLGEEILAILAETTGIAGRFEADQFNIYCVHREDYFAMLSRLQNRVDSISHNVNIRLRMGVMLWQDGLDPAAMSDHAKIACSKVRGDYQHPLMVYDAELREHELLDRRLINDLNKAVEEDQLIVYYQPKYDIRYNPPKLSSAEALIRWKHPNLGMISPGVFIPLFEGNGLIGVIDSFVWSKAAAQIAVWKEKYGFALPVSVNVSRADMFDLTLVDRLETLIKSNGLDHSNLKLEITESAYTEDAEKLIALINRLKELGFEIEMDDFGSGYSSLNMLSSMPVDVLKMDMKFIRNLETSETDKKLVTLILDIAKYLNLTVIAEGAETQKQIDILQDAGCDLVQGYYFSRPLPPEEFEKLIEKEINTER